MGVDVDDHDVIEIALVGLLARVSEQASSIQFLDRHAATAISDEIHSVSPGVPILSTRRMLGCLIVLAARPTLPHTELEHCEIGGS